VSGLQAVAAAEALQQGAWHVVHRSTTGVVVLSIDLPHYASRSVVVGSIVILGVLNLYLPTQAALHMLANA
jgi:hypothetical protein